MTAAVHHRVGQQASQTRQARQTRQTRQGQPVIGLSADVGERLDRLYRDTQRQVRRYLAARCPCREVVDDVTAIVYEHAARRMVDDPAIEVSLPWLYVVAKRRLVDHWRSVGRQRELVERACPDLWEHGPELSSEMWSACHSLPRHYRVALYERYVVGRSVTEVADRLGMGYTAAESLLSRARRRLRAAYDEQLSLELA